MGRLVARSSLSWALTPSVAAAQVVSRLFGPARLELRLREACDAADRAEGVDSRLEVGPLRWNQAALDRVGDMLGRSQLWLQYLRLRCNPSHRPSALEGEDGAELLKGALRNPALRELSVADSLIGDEGAAAVAGRLPNHPSLTALTLRDCGIGDEGADELGGALASAPALTFVSLAGNDIGGRGAGALFASCPGMRRLTSLDLSWNVIGDGVARTAAEALEKPDSPLARVDLRGNPLTAAGVRTIADAAASHVGALDRIRVGPSWTVLARLRGGGASMGTAPVTRKGEGGGGEGRPPASRHGAAAAAAATARDAVPGGDPCCLAARRSGMGLFDAVMLAAVLRSGPLCSLQEVDVSGNDLRRQPRDQRVYPIPPPASHARMPLRTRRVGGPDEPAAAEGMQGLQSLCEAVASAPFLIRLDLSGTGLDPCLGPALADALRSNTVMHWLRLGQAELPIQFLRGAVPAVLAAAREQGLLTREEEEEVEDEDGAVAWALGRLLPAPRLQATWRAAEGWTMHTLALRPLSPVYSPLEMRVVGELLTQNTVLTQLDGFALRDDEEDVQFSGRELELQELGFLCGRLKRLEQLRSIECVPGPVLVCGVSE